MVFYSMQQFWQKLLQYTFKIKGESEFYKAKKIKMQELTTDNHTEQNSPLTEQQPHKPDKISSQQINTSNVSYQHTSEEDQQTMVYMIENAQDSINGNQRISKRKFDVSVGNNQTSERENQNKSQNHRKGKGKKVSKKSSRQQIGDIMIVILLVLMLGVSVFRVVLQVSVEYKKAEQITKIRQKNPHLKIQEINQLSSYELLSLQLRSQSLSTDQYFYGINQPAKPPKKQTTQLQFSSPPPEAPITLEPECQKYIDELLRQHGQLYDFKYPYQEFRLKSRVDTFVEAKPTMIGKVQYEEAVLLLQVVHKVDKDGLLTVQDTPCESRQVKQQRLKSVLQSQKQRLDRLYNLTKYNQNQLPMCLVVNSYNNALKGLIYRNIDSILQQDYLNYHVIYTDDHSTDHTFQKVKVYLQQAYSDTAAYEQKWKILQNYKKMGMMHNIYQAIHHHCSEGEIVVMVDGDDSLVGRNALSLVNAVYQKQKLALMWANFVCIFSNSQAAMGFSRDYPLKQKSQNSFRKLKGFISSHLKTFYVDLFRKINLQDLQSNDGHFFGGASDTAMMLPMLQMANPRIKYLPQILYEYRYDTGQMGNIVNKIPQKDALKKIFSSKPYDKLKDFSFIDKALENTLKLDN